MSARLIIVRHAQATGNLEGRFQATSNNLLTDLGRAQLELLEERLRDIKFDAVYSSPLVRAQQTAQACMDGRDIPFITDERLIEINAGEMDGQFWDDLYERFPEQMADWKERPHLFRSPGGETMEQLYSRVTSAVTDIAARNEGRTILIVTHGVVVRNLMCWAKGLPFERLREVSRWSNTGIGIVEVDGGKPTLLLENDHAHLAPIEE